MEKAHHALESQVKANILDFLRLLNLQSHESHGCDLSVGLLHRSPESVAFAGNELAGGKVYDGECGTHGQQA